MFLKVHFLSISHLYLSALLSLYKLGGHYCIDLPGLAGLKLSRNSFILFSYFAAVLGVVFNETAMKTFSN